MREIFGVRMSSFLTWSKPEMWTWKLPCNTILTQSTIWYTTSIPNSALLSKLLIAWVNSLKIFQSRDQCELYFLRRTRPTHSYRGSSKWRRSPRSILRSWPFLWAVTEDLRNLLSWKNWRLKPKRNSKSESYVGPFCPGEMYQNSSKSKKPVAYLIKINFLSTLFN